MDVHSWHGRLAAASWGQPALAAESREDARPGFDSMNASEYLDNKEVLRCKVNVAVSLLRQARCAVVYTGAGISTASGIGDYATKAAASVAPTAQQEMDILEAVPTRAHHVLTSMYQTGWLHHWVQQNHDGLPQKAGYPQHALNEVHGAWFDPSNPVVHFGARIRPDLFEWMLKTEDDCDLVLAVGTSLCDTPSTADRLAVTASDRLGLIIVSLQRTRLDHVAALKFYCPVDVLFKLIAEALDLDNGGPEDTQATVDREADGCDSIELRLSAQQSSAEVGVEVSGEQLRIGDSLFVSRGPLAGVELVVAGQKRHYIELGHKEVGQLALGRWWFTGGLSTLGIPCSRVAPLPRHSWQDIVEGGLAAAGISPTEHADVILGCAATFGASTFSGIWEGEAVLGSPTARKEHPTAAGDRQQPVRMLLAADPEHAGHYYGSGYTTWPAAQVLCGQRGRVFFTVHGKTKPAPNPAAAPDSCVLLEMVLTWEPKPASQLKQDGSLPQRCWLRGGVHGASFGGTWLDMEGVGGAFLMRRAGEASEDVAQDGSRSVLCNLLTYPCWGAVLRAALPTGKVVECLRCGRRDINALARVVQSDACTTLDTARLLDFSPRLFSYSVDGTLRPWSQFHARWQVLHAVLAAQPSTFSVLDFGSGSGWFSLKSAVSFPEAVVISVEGSVGRGNSTLGEQDLHGNIATTDGIKTHARFIKQLAVKNYIIPEAWSCEDIQHLSEDGPVADVIVAFASLHYIPRLCNSSIPACLAALASLGNIIVVEFASETILGSPILDVLASLPNFDAERQVTLPWMGLCETWVLRRSEPLPVRRTASLIERSLLHEL